MVRTRVGYSGGTKLNPTYYDLGDHSETVEIDYDPQQISYQQLLDVFWSSHSSDQPSYSIQYASRIFVHNGEQRQQAEQSKAEREANGLKLYTSIEPAGTFYRAEDYHQKYYLQSVGQWMSELREIYPDMVGFTDSTLAARLNGYRGGHGSLEQLEAELPSYGLSAESVALLRRMVS